jgi:hypothetical protein
MGKITKTLVQAALELADNEHSKLSEREKELFGLSSTRLRAFLNNLCSKPQTSYLEIGVYRGATILSALYGNEGTKAVGVENFLYDDREPNKKAPEGFIWDNMQSQLEANLQRYSDEDAKVDISNITIIKDSFQNVDWSKQSKFDICFFDVSPVTVEVYQDFFDKVLPAMNTESVVIFSNYSNSQHAEQLDKVFSNNIDKVQVVWKEQRVSSGLSDSTKYYSGIGIFSIKKNNKATNV